MRVLSALNCWIFLTVSSDTLLDKDNSPKSDDDSAPNLDPTNMLTFGYYVAESSSLKLKTADGQEVSGDNLNPVLAECRFNLVKLSKEMAAVRSKCSADPHAPCRSEAALIKHLFRRLLSRLPSLDASRATESTFIGELLISEREMKVWTKYLDAKDDGNQPMVDALLRLDNALNAIDFVATDRLRAHENNQRFLASMLPWLHMALLTVLAGHLVLRLLKHSALTIFLWFITVCFLVSFVWTWLHLYKSKVAESVAQLRSTPLNSCQNQGEMTSAQTVVFWVRNFFGSLQEDPCVRLQKAITLSPFWQVRPLQVFTHTVTEFVLEPFELVTAKFSSCYIRLMRDIPLLHQTIVLLSFFLASLMVLIFLFRYRIRAFYGLINFEPGTPCVQPSNVQQALPTATDNSIGQVEPMETSLSDACEQ